MLNDLKELLQIQSVLGEPLPGAPFGKGCRDALDLFLAKAKSYGLAAGQSHGYCGWAEYGDGDGITGILCHLDVVPAGDGWSYPPYDLTVDNGMMYGRGVADDKGAAIVALHVLKRLKDEGKRLNRRVRVICGCNEENGSACMKHYRAHCELPVMSIVPDADFPVINSEKGIAHLTAKVPCDELLRQNVRTLTAGTRANVVPDSCTVKLIPGCPIERALSAFGSDSSVFSAPALARKIVQAGHEIDDYSVHFFSDGAVIETRGTAGHAMAPEKGDNAFFKIITLFDALSGGQEANVVRSIKDTFCTPLVAEKLGIAVSDDCSGSLTVNLGVAKCDGKTLTLTLDLRLPLTANIDDVRASVQNKLPAGSTVSTDNWSPNLFVNPDSPLVTALLETYTKCTNGTPYCVKCGGGTYARELPNSVAFGPTFPGMITNIHNADECYPVVEFESLPEIYYRAILALDGLEQV